MNKEQNVMSEDDFILGAITLFRKLTAQQQLEVIEELNLMRDEMRINK